MGTRRQRKAEQERRAKQREAANASADDLQQAVVKRSDYVHCKLLGDVYMSSLSLGEQSEVQQEALRYYRMDRLGYKLDELNMMKDRGMLNDDEFDDDLTAIKKEIAALSFDDLPNMTVTAGSEVINCDYQRWFMAATVEGQIAATLAASRYRQPDITKDQLKQIMKEEPNFFVDAASVIMQLTNSLIAKK